MPAPLDPRPPDRQRQFLVASFGAVAIIAYVALGAADPGVRPGAADFLENVVLIALGFLVGRSGRGD